MKIGSQGMHTGQHACLHASSCTCDASNACLYLSNYMHALSAGQQSVQHQAGCNKSRVGCWFTLKAAWTVQAVEAGNRAIDSGLGAGICLLDWSPGPCVEGGPSLAAPAGPPPCACCHVSPCPHGSVFFLPLCLLPVQCTPVLLLLMQCHLFSCC